MLGTFLWSSSRVPIRRGLDNEVLEPITSAALRYGLAAALLVVETDCRCHERAVLWIDRDGHLMDGLDHQTRTGSTPLPKPRVAQVWPRPRNWSTFRRAKTRLSRHFAWQSRPDSNWRYRLERPVQPVFAETALSGETHSDLRFHHPS